LVASLEVGQYERVVQTGTWFFFTQVQKEAAIGEYKNQDFKWNCIWYEGSL
jgi:hypothetical protein